MLVDLCHKVAAHPQGIYTGVRKVVQGVSHEIHALPKVDLAQLGYRGTGQGKIKQLMRNYWNQEHIDSGRQKLMARKVYPHISVAV